MQCHAIILLIYTTGATYSFYEKEDGKETIKEKMKQSSQLKREKEKKQIKSRQNTKYKNRRNNLSCPPPRRRGGQHLKKDKLGRNEKIAKTPLPVNKGRLRNRGKKKEQRKRTKGK